MLSDSTIRAIYEEYLQLYPPFSPFISLTYFPHSKYETYTKWKPDSIRVLFIVESPPWKDQARYFYDETSNGILCRTLFNFLHIPHDQQSISLQEFKSRGFFLIDTIKCIFDKNRHPIPTSLIRWSAQKILAPEIDSLQPIKIVVLGSTAFTGMKSIPKFTPLFLPWTSIAQVSGQIIENTSIPIGCSVYPNDRNRKYWISSKKMFDTFIPH